MRRATIIPVVIALLIGFTAGIATPQLGSVIKGAAVALLVDQFAGDLNKTINNVTQNKNLSADVTTKVVPILSIGKGSYVGGAQVAGLQQDLDQVKAVAQLETGLGKQFRINALIPINARGLSNIKRVPGVGVSAVVDVKL